jgi:2-C-methyl-D-erythritol 4-phosphate cytidylyltransferase/2-C-methyl-D-erythritol 2,4-cyclodiphosphate synthase
MAPHGHETSAIVLAAGAGLRLGEGSPKALRQITGRPMVALAVAAAATCPAVTEIVVAVPDGLQPTTSDILAEVRKPLAVVAGGPTRQASVRAALEAVSDAAVIVVIHDAARALATVSLFSDVIRALGGAAQDVPAVAAGDGVSGADDPAARPPAGAIPVVPVVDTLKRVVGSEVIETIARDDLRAAQTPQAFVAEALRAAHERAARAGIEATDDAAVLEWAGERVVTVDGDPRNFKITTQQDLDRATALLAASGSVSNADG